SAVDDLQAHYGEGEHRGSITARCNGGGTFAIEFKLSQSAAFLQQCTCKCRCAEGNPAGAHGAHQRRDERALHASQFRAAAASSSGEASGFESEGTLVAKHETNAKR